jgi:hypothetical protein
MRRMMPANTPSLLPRRRLVLCTTAAALALPFMARPARAAAVLPAMTEGPFYPRPDWRARGPFAGDWDADLTRVQRGGQVRVAAGETKLDEEEEEEEEEDGASFLTPAS